MSLIFLDWIFPFFILGYGASVTLVLSLEPLARRGQDALPAALWNQLLGHRVLALVCLVVGGIWSLQNIWFETLPAVVRF